MTRPGKKAAGTYTPRLANVYVVGIAAVGLSVGSLVLIFWFLDARLVPPNPESSERTVKVATMALALGGVVGAVLTGVYAYRKQKLEEGASKRADADQFQNRFAQAADLLSHTSAAGRLAGVYAMAALADAWEDQQQLCINVLTAYLQLPWKPMEIDSGEHEVRRAILREIRDHLRDDTTTGTKWYGRRFRFEGAVFADGDLTKARFTQLYVSFHRVRFVNGEFLFNRVAIEEGATLGLTHASFEGGQVSFDGLTVGKGELTFEGATVGVPATATSAATAGSTVTFVGADVRGPDAIVIEGPFHAQIP